MTSFKRDWIPQEISSVFSINTCTLKSKSPLDGEDRLSQLLPFWFMEEWK